MRASSCCACAIVPQRGSHGGHLFRRKGPHRVEREVLVRDGCGMEPGSFMLGMPFAK